MDKTNLLNQLKLGVPDAFEEVYRLHFKEIQAYIIKNSGTTFDARDIFQEAIIVLLLKSRTVGFKLTNLGGFLYKTATQKWLYHLRGKKIIVTTDDKEKELTKLAEEDGINQKKIYDKKAQLAYEVLKEIGENCQRLLDYVFFEKLSHAEVAERMDIDKASVRVIKSRCMKAYRNKIKAHPNFNQLFD